MENSELLNCLNSETKEYLDDVFSYLDFFLQNDDKIHIKSNGKLVKLNSKNYMAYSFLLATIKDDKVLRGVFEKHNLDADALGSYFNMDNTSFDDVKHIKSEDSSYIKSNKLVYLFSDISERLKYNNYLSDTNINLSELRPYQIFDYMLETYYDIYDEICNEFNISLEHDLAKDLCRRIYDFDRNFAKKHGIDVDEEIQKEMENTHEYVFENSSILLGQDESFIIFKDGFDFTSDIRKSYCNTDRNIENIPELLLKNELYLLEDLNGYSSSEFNKELLEKIFEISNDTITLKISTTILPYSTYSLIVNRKSLFKNKTNQIKINDIIESVKGSNPNSSTHTDTPYLDEIGFDLTNDSYIKDPSVGREDKIREIEKVLLYPERDKSIIIYGDAGCGKTALVRGLAYRIQRGDVPEALKNMRIISIDCASLVAGTKYVGTLEEKMKKILREASSSKDILLFMDEIHQALGAGKAEGDDNTVSEILKPYLDYGKVRIIGATTTREYDKYLSQDDAFRTRFKCITLSEPEDYVIYDIIDDLITTYNKFNYSKLLVPENERRMIINWFIDSTRKGHREYFDNSSNPRLVLDVVKDAYALAALDNRTEIARVDIENAILQEVRLSNSSRNDQVKKLRRMMPQQHECKIYDILTYKLKK